MKRASTLFVAAVTAILLFADGRVNAQDTDSRSRSQVDKPRPPSSLALSSATAIGERDKNALAEDLEIMRTILRQAMRLVYRDPHSYSAAFSQFGPAAEQCPVAGKLGDIRFDASCLNCHSGANEKASFGWNGFEAAVLPSYVVFSGTLPSPAADVKPAETSAEPKNEAWERARRELHGQTSGKSESNAVGNALQFLTTGQFSPGGVGTLAVSEISRPTQRQVFDAIIQTLAENGHNLRGLNDNVRIAVAITFVPQQQEQLVTNSGVLVAPNTLTINDQPNGTLQLTLSGGAGNLATNDNLTAQTLRLSGNLGSLDLTSTEENVTQLSADLALKQGDYNRAVKAYEDAVSEAESAAKKAIERMEFNSKPYKTYIELQQKLAQALVGQGKAAEAGDVLAKLIALQERADKARQKPQAGQQRELPRRVTIVTTKSALDRVGKGELSLKQFADEQVEIHSLDPRSEESKSSPRP